MPPLAVDIETSASTKSLVRNRLVPTALHVQGVRSFSKNDFLFDKNICRELPPIIFWYSGGSPAWLLCDKEERKKRLV